MIALILLIIAGIFNACMDVLSFRWDTCIFSNFNELYFNPTYSWTNKWKFDDKGNKIGEKFFGSSTFLVFLTDFWHLCKFLMLVFISAAIVFYDPIVNWWADILIMYCAFTITFELFYSRILILKKNDK